MGTSQAKKLCGMLSADVGEKVRDHVHKMQKILTILDAETGSEFRSLFKRLVTSMARHLHNIRQPAIDNFERLISLSTRSAFLNDCLKDERAQSMVELLTFTHRDNRPVPRTITLEDGDTSGSAILQNVLETALATKEWLSGAIAGDDGATRHESRMEKLLHQPNQDDLQEELRPLSDEDRKNYPDKVVLKPLRLVLRWFEKMQAK